MEVVYRLCSEDVLSFVSNKENGAEIMKQVQRSFSCMEELKVFVEVVESAVNWEKNEKFSLITVVENRLDLLEKTQDHIYTLPSGFTLLSLETDNHLFLLHVEENWCGKFLSYDVYRKEYYSRENYTLMSVVSEALQEQIERDSFYEYSMTYFVRLFVRYLANGKEIIELAKDDESVVLVDKEILQDYLEEDDSGSPDFPKTVKDFKEQYIYDDACEFLNYLSRTGRSYFQYNY